jgi:hypothetical protein
MLELKRADRPINRTGEHDDGQIRALGHIQSVESWEPQRRVDRMRVRVNYTLEFAVAVPVTVADFVRGSELRESLDRGRDTLDRPDRPRSV